MIENLEGQEALKQMIVALIAETEVIGQMSVKEKEEEGDILVADPLAQEIEEEVERRIIKKEDIVHLLDLQAVEVPDHIQKDLVLADLNQMKNKIIIKKKLTTKRLKESTVLNQLMGINLQVRQERAQQVVPNLQNIIEKNLKKVLSLKNHIRVLKRTKETFGYGRIIKDSPLCL